MKAEVTDLTEFQSKNRPDVSWTHPFLPRLLNLIPVEATTLLDIGCGRGVIGALFNVYRENRHSVGVDAWPPYLKEARKYYNLVIDSDLRTNWPILSNEKFDVGCFIEVIEHFPKQRGHEVLQLLEHHCKRVIVSTPGRFFRQNAYDKNPGQQHVSAWTRKEFEALGYQLATEPVPILGHYLRSLSWRVFPRLFQTDMTILAYKDQNRN
jgi:2-polyprenyl-3-methyl-5-hydroxy-6-metoxy-1,4-benzoquinol methylase